MQQEHERIEQLLAAHALGALSGEDAIEVDHLLAEHVPSCPLCRETLAGFRAVAAELALKPSARTAPDLALARIRRSIRQERSSRGRSATVATAAGVAALVGMAALSLSLGSRANRAETHLDKMGTLFDALSQPGASPVRLEAFDSTLMVEVSGPTLERMIVAGRGIPKPAAGHVYMIWIGTETELRPLGSAMPDEDGFVYRTFEVDPSSFDRILITEERAGTRPETPRADSPHTWQATL